MRRPDPAAADVLPDLLAPGLALVICGSAAGNVSAARGTYYAHPQNRFWPILATTGLTPRLLAPEEYPLLRGFGIGLTDMTKTESGPDAGLRTADPARLAAAVGRLRPRALAFNGKRAAGLFLGRRGPDLGYGRQPDGIGGMTVFVLPSISPLAVAFWDAAPWHEMATFVRSN
ncbi:MAG: mismatch-specific DNA-glycosylase [Alphaproteobacteria bacterium]|nr:mismatch-specific DNA-glycosylase [Alphaproteobacteria bacterium]